MGTIEAHDHIDWFKQITTTYMPLLAGIRVTVFGLPLEGPDQSLGFEHF